MLGSLPRRVVPQNPSRKEIVPHTVDRKTVMLPDNCGLPKTTLAMAEQEFRPEGDSLYSVPTFSSLAFRQT